MAGHSDSSQWDSVYPGWNVQAQRLQPLPEGVQMSEAKVAWAESEEGQSYAQAFWDWQMGLSHRQPKYTGPEK